MDEQTATADEKLLYLKNIQFNENIIDDRFLLGKKLGEGLIANVYQCYDLKEKKFLALKLIRDLVVKKYGKSVVEKEVGYLQKADQFNLSTKLFHYSFEGKKWDFLTKRFEKKSYIVIELMEKGEFFDLLSGKKFFPTNIARFFFKQIAESLLKLKSLNIAHRDLKMENIVVDQEYNLKIIDFGQSTEIFNEKGVQILHKEFIGTEKYRPPEMNENVAYHGDKADIFTLGVILFSMLFGKVPFQKAIQSDKCYKYIYKQDYTTFWGIIKEDNIPIEAVELLNKMFCYNFQNRISIEEILQSEFLKGDTETRENIKFFFGK
jgi:serine/threonine protein kinase